MNERVLAMGKLPYDFLAEMLAILSMNDEQVLVGPGTGMDCAVIDSGDKLLVLKSDPITFTADNLGEYLVQITVNDVATTGALPRWLLVTFLFPKAKTTPTLVASTFQQLEEACAAQHITVVGGHTEITNTVDRPVAVGTLIGEVSRENLVTPRGAMPGDQLLLTKTVPIEAVAILADAFRSRLLEDLTEPELLDASRYLEEPGISVLKDAKIATTAGQVNAMHDPTEGGLLTALWELADACGQRIVVNLDAVPVSDLARRICTLLNIDPLGAISSGALLLSVAERDQDTICTALRAQGIPCAPIGRIEAGSASVWPSSGQATEPLARPARDEIARLFDESAGNQ